MNENHRFRNSRIIAIAVIGLMTSSSLGIVFVDFSSTRSLPAMTMTTDPYPNSGWLNIWQCPNQSDTDTADYFNELPGEDVFTPIKTAEYWGSDYYNVWNVDELGHMYLTYTWAEMNNSAIFPTTSKISVCLQPDNTVGAKSLSYESLNNTRIYSAWVQGRPDTPTELKYLYDNLTSINPNLKLFVQFYDATYDSGNLSQQSFYPAPYGIQDFAPYFDGIWISPWPSYTYNVQRFHQYFYSIVKDLASKIPTKTVCAEIFNWAFDDAVYPWDYTQNVILDCARLYREGIIKEVILAGCFFTQWTQLTSSYMRNIFNTEFKEYETSVNLALNSVQTTVDDQPTSAAVGDIRLKWANNYTFYSFHTQRITFSGIIGSNLTVKNLRTGIVTILTNTTFVAAMGECYQVYNWPHATITYQSPHKNWYVNSTTSVNNTLVLIDGNIFANGSLTLNNVVVQFSAGRYVPLDYIAGDNFPDRGLYTQYVDNHTFNLQNTTIQPLNSLFPYVIDEGHIYGSTLRNWYICNSSINGWALIGVGRFPALRFSGATVWIADSIFSEPIFGSGTRPLHPIEFYSGYIGTLKFVRNLIYSENSIFDVAKSQTKAYSQPTLGLYLDTNGTLDNNTIVGFSQGIAYGHLGFTGTTLFSNANIYRADYNVTEDDHGANAFPSPYSRDMAKFQGYTDVNYDASVADNEITTTKFRIRGDYAFSGTLRDAEGSTIGAYSSINNAIEVYNIGYETNLLGVIHTVHPFPWTFEITSSLSTSYYWAVQEYGTFGVNRSLFQPMSIPVTGNTITIQPEDAWDLHLVRLTKDLYEGMPLTIHPGYIIDFGERLYLWALPKYVTPEQVPICVDTSTTLEVNITTYTPTADLLAAWTATASSGWAVFTLTGLPDGAWYSVKVDGSDYAIIQAEAGAITFAYTGPWSAHQFEVYPIFDSTGVGAIAYLIVIVAAVIALLPVVLFVRSYKKEELTMTSMVTLAFVTIVALAFSIVIVRLAFGS